jgi:hypothetical protein
MIQIQFTLSFDKNLWVCYNNQVKLVADSLDEIDDKLETFIKNKYQKGNFEIDMHFDFDKFPTWMRQYMPHYFNRNLHFQID